MRVIDSMKPTTTTPAQFIGASSAVVFILSGCAHVKPLPQTVQVYQASGSRPSLFKDYRSLFSQKDYQRLVSIQQEINQTQRISDADVTFLVRELSLFPPQNTSSNSLAAANFVLDHTYGLKPKRLTLSQSRRLYNAVVPYTRILDSGTQVNAALALTATHDPRAIGRLQNLVWSSPYPVVRLSAKVFLGRPQKVVASPPK